METAPNFKEVTQLPWKLAPTSAEVNPWSKFTSMEMEIFMDFSSTNFHERKSTSMEASTNFHGIWKQASFYRGSSGLGLELGLGLGLVLRKHLDVCDARGSRCESVGVYGSSWELPRNIFGQAAIDGSNGSVHFHRQWKRPCTSKDASINFHGSKYTATNFHGNFHGSKYSSTDFHESFHGRKLTSMEVFMEVGGNLLRRRSSRWTRMEVLWKQLEVCDTRGNSPLG